MAIPISLFGSELLEEFEEEFEEEFASSVFGQYAYILAALETQILCLVCVENFRICPRFVFIFVRSTRLVPHVRYGLEVVLVVSFQFRHFFSEIHPSKEECRLGRSR